MPSNCIEPLKGIGPFVSTPLLPVLCKLVQVVLPDVKFEMSNFICKLPFTKPVDPGVGEGEGLVVGVGVGLLLGVGVGVGEDVGVGLLVGDGVGEGVGDGDIVGVGVGVCVG